MADCEGPGPLAELDLTPLDEWRDQHLQYKLHPRELWRILLRPCRVRILRSMEVRHARRCGPPRRGLPARPSVPCTGPRQPVGGRRVRWVELLRPGADIAVQRGREAARLAACAAVGVPQVLEGNQGCRLRPGVVATCSLITEPDVRLRRW
jgi:hypothetical protein